MGIDINSMDFVEEEDDSISSFKAWLSLIDFPDDTRVKLTKRGRSFIFQSAPVSVIELIGRANWHRYRSSTESPIPLGILRSLLNNDEKELFIASFSVTELGSQKLQIPLRLPLKVQGSPLFKILALMCLTRNVFSTGNFQTENQEKAEEFDSTFDETFGVQLPKGTNKRGAYIRIPVQVVQAFLSYFTGKPKATIFEIIESVEFCAQEDMLNFINTWFSFYRIYRNTKQSEHLFVFRKRDITDSIARLLEKTGIEFDPGMIQESGQSISIYGVKRSKHNLSFLNLPFLDNQATDQKMLLYRIESLGNQIKAKDDKINVLEDLTNKLKLELADEHTRMLAASYSQYYFEIKTKKLEEKFLELQQIRENLREENIRLKDNMNSEDLSINQQETLDKEYSSIDITKITKNTLRKVINEIKSSKNFDDQSLEYVERAVIQRVEYVEQQKSSTAPKLNWMVRGEDEINVPSNILYKSNLANPTLTSHLIQALTLLMAKKENQVLLTLSDGKIRTETELRDIIGLNLAESKKVLALITDTLNLDINVLKDGQPAYQIKPEVISELRIKLKGILNNLPVDVRSEWKELFQL